MSRFSTWPEGVDHDTCPKCRSQILELGPPWERMEGLYTDRIRLGREERRGSRFREVLGQIREAMSLRYTRRRRDEAGDRDGILSLNVR